MTKPVRSLVSLLALLLFGCGGNLTTPPASSPTGLAVLDSSAFSFTGTSRNFNTTIIFLGGPLQSDRDGNVAGTLGITTNPSVSGCFPEGSKAIFSGKLSDQGLLTLTSQPVAGQVVTLNATVSSDGNLISNATYAVMGGCLGGDQGTMAVAHLLSGTYTGTFLGIDTTVNFEKPTVLIPEVIQGLPLFPLNATATFSHASGCGGFSSGSTLQGGGELGLRASFTLDSNVSGIRVDFGGSIVDNSGTTFSGNLVIQGGPCNSLSGPVTLNLKKL